MTMNKGTVSVDQTAAYLLIDKVHGTALILCKRCLTEKHANPTRVPILPGQHDAPAMTIACASCFKKLTASL